MLSPRMLRRLGIGLLKGLVVGIGLGVGFQVGLGWGTTTGLLGYLLAMGFGATAGILCGKAPWRAESWIEAVLKGVFGVGVGALVYWVGSSYLAWQIPFALPYAAAGGAWTAQPLLYAPVIGAVFGTIVELDNDESAPKRSKAKNNKKVRSGPRTRVTTTDLDEVVLSGGQKKKSAR